jgi:phosphate transport system substrate-binding protein
MRSAIKFVLALGITALLLSGCQNAGTPTPTPTPAPQSIGVTPLYLDWASDSLLNYLEKHEGADFKLDILPVEAGLTALQNGEIELLIAAFEPESTYFTTALKADGIAVIHHPDLRLEELGLDDLRKIFAGAEQNWQAFGGRDLPIYPIIPLPGDDLRSLFQARVMGTFRFSSLARLQASPGQTLELVQEEPGAVAFIPFSMLEADTAFFHIAGQKLSLRSIENGRYPLSYWVAGIALDEPGGELRDWILSVQSGDS